MFVCFSNAVRDEINFTVTVKSYLKTVHTNFLKEEFELK